MTPEENRDLESRMRTLSDRLLEDIDWAVTKSKATTQQTRESILRWFGVDVFDAYADWLEEGE